ncbi:hypothetical protein M433DRAFT_496623 [Acidomyces richmondensis BFW]|nr:MAG: hypothetical protein FE78DRAFT_301242 [Acidomyces sp. 'richmondensis']KYG47401.1 hypothetical protein M433DRAFT_496623 [Acidomyces richmondensis BFW]
MALVNGQPSSSAAANGKLSGGADIFSPRRGSHDTGGSSKPSGSKTPISLLNHNTMPDQPTIVSSEPQPIGSSRVATRSSPKKPFTTDVGEFNGSHVLKVINLTGKDLHDNGIVNHLVLEVSTETALRDRKRADPAGSASGKIRCATSRS